MATRSAIGIKQANGKIKAVYCHYDGYPKGVGKTLLENYNSKTLATKLISLGDISSLDEKMSKPKGHSFENRIDGYTVFYGRDRGEKNTKAKIYDDLSDLFSYTNADYVYIFEDGKWLYANHKYKELNQLTPESYAKGGAVSKREIDDFVYEYGVDRKEAEETLTRRKARLSAKENKRLAELTKKVRTNSQTDSEDIEWDKLVHKYRAWEYKKETGGSIDTDMKFKKGTYYIGDLGYVMKNQWDEICDLTIKDNDVLSGVFTLKDGTQFAIYGTAYGDGEYYDQEGNSYSVDSGTLGCVKVSSKIDVKAGEGLGMIVEMDNDFTTGYNDEDETEIFFDNVMISTGSEEEEEDYEDDYDEDEDEYSNGGSIDTDQSYYRVFKNSSGKDIPVKIVPNPIMNRYDYYVDGGLRGSFKSYEDAEKEVSRENFELYKDGGNIDSGLMVIGRTQLDNNKIQDIIQENDFYADWDSREGYWFFPEEVENYDALEESLSELFDEEGINARFEGIFAKGGKMSKSNKTSKKTPKPKMVRQYFEDQPYTYKDGGNIEDLEYQDIYNVLKEKIDESMDDLPVDYENSSSYNGEEVEYRSRDGFMAFTNGGYEASWMEYISNFNGAGKSLPTKQLDAEMQRQVEYNYNWAKEKFIEEYPEIVEELGEENIDYNSLYEADYGDEAEQLSEWEMDFEDDSILCEIGAYYYNPDNYRGIDGEHTVRLFGKVNLESPYHRAGNLEDTYDIDITFDSISELETKLSEGLAKIISWFEGDFYNDSDTELAINRMARGGGVTKGEYKIGDKLLLNTKKGKIEALVTKKSDKWTQFDDLTNNKKARWKSTDEVIELMEVLKTQLKKLKATNTTSTTKPAIKTTTSRGKDLAEITLKKLKAVAKKQKAKLGLDVNDVKSLVDAGFTSDEIVSVYAGYTTTVNADTEFGDTSGNLFYSDKEYQKEIVKKITDNAKERLFEAGLKYPSFNWSKIISKYDIKLTPKIIERETPYGTTYRYEVYFGNGIAIGHNVGYTEAGEYRNYGEEIGKIDLKKPSAYQKERDYKAGFNGGYWGIVVRKKEDLFSIVDSLLAQKTGYLKDLEMFNNGLGGIGGDEVENEKFATGGKVKNFYNEVGNHLSTLFNGDVELEEFDENKNSRFIRYILPEGEIMNIEQDWKTDGTSTKPVTEIHIYPDTNIRLGRFAIWQNPKEYAQDIFDVIKEKFSKGGNVKSKYYTLWSDEEETIRTDFDKYEDALSDFKQFENNPEEIELYEIVNGKEKLLKKNSPSNNITYLKLSNSDVVVEIEKRDGKWVEGSVLEGEKPYGWGVKKYMGYLQPNDIINYLNSDYKTDFMIVEQYAKGGGVGLPEWVNTEDMPPRVIDALIKRENISYNLFNKSFYETSPEENDEVIDTMKSKDFELLDKYFRGELQEEKYAKGGGVSKRNYNYIPQDEIDYLMTEYGRKIDGSKLLDGAYAKGKSKAPKVTRTQFEDESFEYANGGGVGRPVRKKFVLYTNPNNSTSRAYIAVGTDVKDVLRDAREYPGSYSILYQATGTNEDLQKAKSMFSNYSFDSSIEIMATGGVVEKYKVVKVFRKSGRREILEKNLTLEEAKRVVSRYPNSNTSMVIFTKM